MTKLSTILTCIFLLISIPKVFCQLKANLIGNAENQGNDCYLITPDLNNQYGAIWYENAIDFSADFEIVFDAYFGANDANGADGMALVFKTTATPELGGLGGELGYGGISSSFAVEFDTYQNVGQSDPESDHIGLMINGDSRHNANLPLVEFSNLENDSTHEIKFLWSAESKKITVTKDCDVIISYVGDIVDLALNGSSTAYFGFTGSTGGATNKQRICFKHISFVKGLPNQVICEGNILDTVDATFSDAVSYSWKPKTGVSDPTSPNPTFTPTTTTTYEVTITQKCGNIFTEKFTVTISKNPTVSTPTGIETCVDNIGTYVFDLTQKETEILSNQNASDFEITYFTDSGYTNQISDPRAFSVVTVGVQPIYIRVKNKRNDTCYTDTTFNIEVYESPKVSHPSRYEQCDDDSNNGQAFFNLELDNIKEEINSNYIALGLKYTFYESQSEAEINGMKIINPSNYQYIRNHSPDTLWLRIENPKKCFKVVPLELLLSPSSAALASYTPNPIYKCDDGSDLRDGVASFDLTNIKRDITNTIFSTVSVSVHFYESQLDAELEINDIVDITNHKNESSPNMQDIWVRVKSDLGNRCLGLEKFSSLLIVEKPPIAYDISSQLACDDDNDGWYAFDTSMIASSILNEQSISELSVHYNYIDTDGIAVTNATSLPNPFLTKSQTISVTLTNKNTLNPNGPCYDDTFIEFRVDKQPFINNTVTDQVFCDGVAGDVDNDGYYPFDTSLFKDIILGNQIGVEIYFTYLDGKGNLVVDSNTLPNPLISTNQTILVDVKNQLNPNCIASTTIDLEVNALPEFYIETPQIVCSSDPSFTIILDPVESNPSETYTYLWMDDSGTLLSTSPTLTVSTPGTINLTLAKTDGTGCSRTQEIFINSSELATITLDKIKIEDISDNNRIIIDASVLGLGDYEYALDDALSFYQDEPVFENVKGGRHTVYIRDKKGCGVVSIEISVIDYPKFFTPNGDGDNDFWKILGVNDQFQAGSDIYIYNRYGKLLKQLNPNSRGWNGDFNNNSMPNDDYWFKVLLQDGRVFMGHFALKR